MIYTRAAVVEKLSKLAKACTTTKTELIEALLFDADEKKARAACKEMHAARIEGKDKVFFS